MQRNDLVGWLNDYLKIKDFPDLSLNGLQFSGREEVSRIGAAVDASLATFEKAAEAGVDFLLVHHGLFWGKPLAVTGAHKKRLAVLFKNGMNLYAAHLPLDAHTEVGNNTRIATELGLVELEPFGSYKNLKIGFKGRFPTPTPLSAVADTLGKLTGMQVLVHQGGPELLSSVGIISGAAAWSILEAEEEGLDLFITGEPKHEVFHETFEGHINAIYAGHYDTEVFGVKALAAKLEGVFQLPWTFVNHPTGL